MAISKGKNLKEIYLAFLKFAYDNLNSNKILGVYTNEDEIFIKQLDKTKWQLLQILKLKIVTNVNSYLYPSIIICKKI